MSKFLSVNWEDALTGLAVAAFGAVLFSIKGFLDSCGFSCIDWGNVLTVGVDAGLGFIIAKFFSNSDNKFGRAEE